MVPIDRRACLGRFVAAGITGAGLTLGGCAGLLGRDSVRVTVVGLEPLAGEGMEVRMAVKLRLQNPGDTALDYDGIAIELELRGNALASGVSSERGSIPRFGEAVVTVPVSISAFAMLRQALQLAGGQSARIDYTLRGRLAGSGFGGMRFASSGEIDLPTSLGLN